jgi:2-phosphosulfolactate phosphatase
VGRAARALAAGGPVGVVAAGERWRGTTGPLRPAVEDLLAAGAVLAAAGPPPERSVEAAVAVGALDALAAVGDVSAALLGCASGRELVERGRRDDVLLAAAVDATDVVPVLVDGTFRGRSGGVGELGP